MDFVRTACPYCGVGCGVLAKRTGPRSANIAGDPDHPANHGRLCSKGTHLGETIGLEGRLLHPTIGNCQASWDDALDLVAERFSATIAEHGPDSVAFYVSGQLLTEDYYAANKLMKGFIGSANIDTNSRLCMASAVAAHNRAFGEDLVPACYDDLDEADLVVLVGSNTAWCHPVVWQRIEAARERRGTRLVVLDPRRTETAEGADLFLKLRAGTDIALFKGLEAYLLARGDISPDAVAQRVTVPDDYWDGLASYGVEQAAATCDLPAEDVRAFYELFAATPRTVTMFSQGVNQSTHGTDKANAIINLHLITDRIGKPGAAPFSITGQPNAMGGREVGGLSSALAAHMSFTPEDIDRVGRFWGTSNMAQRPGLKAVDLFKAVGEGRIKALWVMATNPAVSMPDAGKVRQALAECPFVVVSEIIADTDTARLAHVRLPALGWGEKDGTVTNSERRVSRQRPFLAPPGEARADWSIIAQVAGRMGFGEQFAWDSPAAVFREHCALTAFENEGTRRLDLGAWSSISDNEFETLPPFQWGGERLAFSRTQARLITVDQPPLESGMMLNTGRYRDQWHTMTRTALSPRLSQHRREPLVEVHPNDACASHLGDGDLARVSTEHGDSIFRVAITEAQRPGEIFVPIHWTDRVSSGGRAGLLVSDAVDPVSGQPGLKLTATQIEKVVPEWRAFLLMHEAPPEDPGCLWWTKVKVAGGWLFELAGNGDEGRLKRLLPEGELIEASDATRGVRRMVITNGGRLAGALFVARHGDLPPRDWLIAQLADEQAAPLFAYLAARAPGRSVSVEPAICVCFNIGRSAICKAIGEAGAASVAAIGSVTRAGTNCGSCRPELARILAEREPALVT
ncbi:MAG: molybdopterin-dependent oxidoreductase [Sphingomicrobium sp.]